MQPNELSLFIEMLVKLTGIVGIVTLVFVCLAIACYALAHIIHALQIVRREMDTGRS